MSDLADWQSEVRQEAERVSMVFITARQFTSAVHALLRRLNSPLAGLQFEIQCPSPYVSRTLGRAAAGSPDARTISLKDNRETKCRIGKWEKEGVAQNADILDPLLETLFKNYWKPHLRTQSAGMVDLKDKLETKDLAQRTVETWSKNGGNSALLFADLDNFGLVNKQIGHETGDRVIREFGAVLESVCSDDAILLHKGGDEFVLLIPEGSGEEALILAFEIWRALKRHDFNTMGVELGFSCGLATTEEDEKKNTFEGLVKTADRALIEYAKKPKKGRARFVERAPLKLGYGTEMRINIAHCLVKSSMFDEAPFANVWLNCLSSVIRNAELSKDLCGSEIKKCADEFINWADFTISSESESVSASARDSGFDSSPKVSPVDCAFAVIHGLFSHSTHPMQDKSGIPPQLIIKHGEQATGCELILSEGNTLLILKSGVELPNKFEIGHFWQLSSNRALRPETSARAVLVQVGNEDMELPSTLFAERIIVDDRLTRGGGLPDLWEATIARLIAQVLKNPNIAAVYLFGNHAYASRTVAKLKEVDAWTADKEQISYKTGMSVESIQAGSRALEGKVSFPRDCNELVEHLAGTLRLPHIIQPPAHLPDSQRSHGFLKREMQMDEIALGRKDGCRVRTVAEAYPVVLEIARQAIEERPIRDQAGQELRELIDFKIHLSNPTENLVPEFYAHESNSMEIYFKKEFLDGAGIFGRPFQHLDQMEAVLSHLVRVVCHPERQFATRRAILVVPHEIKTGSDLAPLGLVSVRCTPRYLGLRIALHFSYTWRTVEALVGLPYSLYGSVRFSQFLTGEVRTRVHSDIARQIEMGELSYIAHSLHMFVDEYGQNIAKRIVDDASI